MRASLTSENVNPKMKAVCLPGDVVLLLAKMLRANPGRLECLRSSGGGVLKEGEKENLEILKMNHRDTKQKHKAKMKRKFIQQNA